MHDGAMTKRIEQAEAEPLLAPGEAAKLLHVHPRTLQRMVDRGELEAVVLPSGHRRYQRAEVEAIRNRTSGKVVA